jgi:outer membrane protein TolC
LSNNVSIKIQELQPKIAETGVDTAKSVFDPLAFADASQEVSRIQTLNPLITGAVDSLTNNIDVNLGLSKKLSTGATAALTFNNTRLSTNSILQQPNPAYIVTPGIILAQPLLRGFGREYNLAPIVIAQNNTTISEFQFQSQVMDIILQVQQTYWNLVRAIQNLNVAKRSLRLARDLLTINKAKVEAGQLAPLDVVDAEAEVASREAAVIVAADAIRDLEDQLKNILNLDGKSQWNGRAITPLDRPLEAKMTFSFPESLETAFRLRPEYLQAKIDLDNRILNIKVAKNELMPRLDVTGGASLVGTESAYGSQFKDLHGQFYDVRVGVHFEYPLGNRAAKSELIRRQYEQRGSELQLDDLKKNITIGVREAIRKVETNFKRIEATVAARRLAEKKLEAEQAKFKVGLSTTYNVLQFQRDLVSAQSDEVSAIVDYNISIYNLYRQTGTTLQKSGINIQKG